MESKAQGAGLLPQRVPLPSIHLHPSLSTSSRHQQTSTTLASPQSAVTSRPKQRQLPRLSSTSAVRTTSRASTASSLDGNSDDESDIPPGRHSSYRHHPYQSHHSHQSRPRLSISPLDSRRASLYSRSYDDMGTVLRTSLSASDEGSNSNSYYDGDSRAPSMSPLTTSPSFTFIGQRQDREMADGSATGGLGASPGGGGSQSAAPLSLDSLPSYPPDQKPPFSYPVLIRLAILGSPQKRLLLSQIYSAIEDKFPWYKDSAPKAWKASVRHCLSLNKEFVRMQRAVEDPGVGCGGWWSVGEGMKGLKRPRKRRPAQAKRDQESDHASFVNAPTPSPLAIRRRHSSTFDDPPRVDPYPRYVSPFSSSSLPPMKAEPQTRPLVREPAMEKTLPAIEDYSLRLPPLQIPNPAQPLPTPPSSSRTVIFGNLAHAAERDRDTKGYTHGYSLHGGYKSARGSHTPTASSSSSYSTQSYGSASTSASSNRPNPMSISSLLNDKPSGAVSGMLVESFDKMDVEMGEAHEHDSREVIPPKKRDGDVKMRGEVTPFSSDQTLRPPSPDMDSPRSHGRRSTTPVAPSGQRHRAQPRSSSRSGAAPPRPTRPPPPLPTDDVGTTSRPTSERRSAKASRSSRGA